MTNNFDNHFAIIVGIDDYGQSTISNLNSAQKDASDLHDYLTKFGGYKTENAKLIIGDKATKYTINGCINEFKGRFANNSTLLFYFSGHGSNLNEDIQTKKNTRYPPSSRQRRLLIMFCHFAIVLLPCRNRRLQS